MPYSVIDPSLAQAAPATTLGTPLTNTGVTLLSLRTELKKQIIRNDVDDTRWNSWINKAYRKVTSMMTLQEYNGSVAINTVVSQPFYLLPAAVGYIKKVALADPIYYPRGGIDFQRIDLDYYRRLPVRSGQPEMYFRQARVLVIWPTPDTIDTMVVDFRIRPADLVDDTDSPIIPLEWHTAIELYARHIAFRSLQMFDKAMIAKNDFVSELREVEQVEGGEDQDLEPQISARTYKRSHSRYRWPSDDCDDRR